MATEARSPTIGFQVMSNPIVMEKVAARLPPKDLRALRPTCTLWNRQFVPEFRKKHAPIYLKLGAGTNAAKLADLLCCQTPHEIPFQNFYLVSLEDPANLEEFLDVCGTMVRSLTIGTEAEKKLGAEGVHRLVFGGKLPDLAHLDIIALNPGVDGVVSPWAEEATSELPKLRRLQFQFYFPHPHGLDHNYQRMLAAIIRAASGLAELVLGHPDSEKPRSAFLHTLLCSLRPSSGRSPLKSLHTSTLLATDLQLLTELGASGILKLESFSTSVHRFWFPNNNEAPVAAEALCAFLATQSQNLVRLQVAGEYFHGDRHHGWVRLPHLERLRSLVLRMDECGDLGLEGGYLEACFPNLRSFEVTDFTRDTLDVMVHSGVQTLRVNMTRFTLDRFAPLLPMVTRADLNISWFSGYPIRLWTWWPHLVELKIRGRLSVPLDSFLTGVPPAQLRNLRREPCPPGLSATMEPLRAVRDKWAREPGICNLDQLQKLTLHLRCAAGHRLTDKGVYFGLALGGPRLRSIKIRYSGNSISEEACSFLRSALGPEAIIELTRVDQGRASPRRRIRWSWSRILRPISRLISRLRRN